MAAEGYPGSYKKGQPISGLKDANALPGIVVFHAGTKEKNGEVLTHGGRVLGVTAIGADTPTAINRAYEAVNEIHWQGVQFRKDIGSKAGP